MRGTAPDEAERAVKARCRTDRRLFARYFFHLETSDERTEKAIPFSRFHLAALDAPKPGYLERGDDEGWKRAVMGPRGNGKTTIYLRVELTHDIVYLLERYIIILGESAGLARSRVREIASVLEFNERIQYFYGDLVGEELWRKGTGEIDTANGVSLRAKSMESQIRGLLHERTNARPTKIVLDDAEDSQDVLNPELRERDRRRFHEDISGAASTRGTTCFQFTGTPLHREALLPSLKANPAWSFRAFPAIEKWPKRTDLWERCRELWAAAGAPEEGEDGEEARAEARAVAAKFYNANRREMDRGARVLWPAGESLFALMLWRWTHGEAAFSKEKLLVPRDPSLATFDVDAIVRHQIDEGERALIVHQRGGVKRVVPLDALRFVAFHDPAKADPKAKKRAKSLGDFAAIVVIGVEERKNGGRFGHVVDVWIERQGVTDQIGNAFRLGELWKLEHLVVEDDTLGLLGADYRRIRRERRDRGDWWQLPIKRLERQTTNKDARIASLEPGYANGWLTWNVALPLEYVNQHRDHPTGDHDDGPDATEGAWRSASKRGARLAYVELD